MKRIIGIGLIILFVFMMFACGATSKKNVSDAANNGNQVIDLIYEVDNGQYNAEDMFFHKNMISNEDQYYVDHTANPRISLKLGDVQVDMEYAETRYMSVGCRKVHKYFVDGDTAKKVWINDDGTVYFIGYEYAYLDIAPNATPNEVCDLLKIELSKIVDMSRYTDVNIPEVSPSEDGFGMYDYLFYNTVNGYMADYLRVTVNDEGAVFGVMIRDIKVEVPTVNIDENRVDRMITLKLKDVYDTDHSEYKSYTTHYEPIIALYKDQVYIEFFVSARYIRTQDKIELSSFLNSILVPLDLIME